MRITRPVKIIMTKIKPNELYQMIKVVLPLFGYEAAHFLTKESYSPAL